MAIRVKHIDTKDKSEEVLELFHPQKYIFRLAANPIDIKDMIQMEGDIQILETEGSSIESMIQRIIPKLPQELTAMSILIRISQTKPLDVLKQVGHIIKWVWKIPCRIKVTWGVEPIENQTENFKITLLVVSNKANNQNQTLK
ncbi:MAG: hypothetical protein K2H60_06925 [Muribaculaceae bacterium]|nr:hypothetical protein [Muribaculaceae bacterium]